ncbi:WD40 repeat-like protein [Suillus brevipes Sb2]|nr:WD40 repeat-like protein [Suillus brevipes Sb2]
MSQLIPSTTPLRTFGDHEDTVRAVAVFPDRRRMVTGSRDKTLRLWDLETGVVLKKMEGHSSHVEALAVSRDGQMIASGDIGGEFIAWHGENGESLNKPIKVHFKYIYSVDFSPDGTVLATCSDDGMTKFWCTKTWQMQGDPIKYGPYCIRYSPPGDLLAITTDSNIQIYNPGTRERVASFKGHTKHNLSLAWTPDGTRLLSGGDEDDPTIREWDPLTWQQVGLPWEGHTDSIWATSPTPVVPSAQEAKRSASRFFVASWPRLHPNYLLIINHVRKFQNKNYIFEQDVGNRKSKSTNYYTT